VKGWSSGPAVASGWNLKSDEAQPSSSLSPIERSLESEKEQQTFCILVVEDSPADVMLIEEALSEHQVSAKTTVVRDGEAAIRHIEQVDNGHLPCPDLVILDLNLPRKTGAEVLQYLRASSKCHEVPVVVLSSSAAPDDQDRVRALGCSLYLTKPPVFEEFLRIGATLKDILLSREPS